MAKQYDLELIVEHAPEHAFFGNLNYFGPPGRDFRWCCKTNKLGPTVKAIMEHFPDGVLSFIGQRKYESEQRADKPRIWRNPWTPGQIGASPIQHWTALHVWIYIFMRKAPYNPWYSRVSTASAASSAPPRTWRSWNWLTERGLRRWNAYLEICWNRSPAEGMGRAGLWRWKRIPPSVKEELARNGITIEEL